MKRNIVVVFLIALMSMCAWAAEPKTPAPKSQLLPAVFAGWHTSALQTSADPTLADATNPGLLKEFGFKQVEKAEYTKPDRKITVKAARFADATGAYGAFTFYKTPEMATETIGDQASSNNERVLFYKGNILVDVTLDRVTVTSAGELRELANDLPKATGSSANLPIIPTYLAEPDYIKNSAKYVVGPIGLSKIGSPIPANLIDFSAGPEVALGQYRTDEGVAQMTLISYPTPALAAVHLKEIEGWHPSDAPGAAVYAKRTGPIVAVMTGAISGSEARSMLASINYDADVTWNQATKLTRNDHLGSMLVNIIFLIGIIAGLSIVAGIAFGGVRILLKRLFPDRVFDRPQDVEIIRLNIGK